MKYCTSVKWSSSDVKQSSCDGKWSSSNVNWRSSNLKCNSSEVKQHYFFLLTTLLLHFTWLLLNTTPLLFEITPLQYQFDLPFWHFIWTAYGSATLLWYQGDDTNCLMIHTSATLPEYLPVPTSLVNPKRILLWYSRNLTFDHYRHLAQTNNLVWAVTLKFSPPLKNLDYSHSHFLFPTCCYWFEKDMKTHTTSNVQY